MEGEPKHISYCANTYSYLPQGEEVGQSVELVHNQEQG